MRQCGARPGAAAAPAATGRTTHRSRSLHYAVGGRGTDQFVDWFEALVGATRSVSRRRSSTSRGSAQVSAGRGRQPPWNQDQGAGPAGRSPSDPVPVRPALGRHPPGRWDKAVQWAKWYVEMIPLAERCTALSRRAPRGGTPSMTTDRLARARQRLMTDPRSRQTSRARTSRWPNSTLPALAVPRA